MDLAQLRNVGYTIAPGVVEGSVIARLLDALREVGGIDVQDPATWAGKRTQVAMGGHQAQWDVCQHPGVYAAFAEAYGDERLAVSRTGSASSCPARARSASTSTRTPTPARASTAASST